MAAFNKFQPFVEGLAHGEHNFSTAVFKLALTNNANPPLTAEDDLLDLVQISYANMGATNPTLTRATSGQTTGTYDLVLNDYTITASGGPVAAFRYVVIYNSSTSTPADQLIGWYDYLSDLVLADGESLVVDFNSDGGTDGSLLTLA